MTSLPPLIDLSRVPTTEPDELAPEPWPPGGGVPSVDDEDAPFHEEDDPPPSEPEPGDPSADPTYWDEWADPEYLPEGEPTSRLASGGRRFVTDDSDVRVVDVAHAGEEMRALLGDAAAWALEEPNRAAVVDAYPPGCLSGETTISVNRGGCARQFPLREVAARQGRAWRSDIPTRTASVYGSVLRLNTLLAAFSTGRRTTLLIRTKSGREIRATRDHRFLTPAGWRALGDLRCGDEVAIRALERSSKAPHKRYYRVRNGLWYHPFARRKWLPPERQVALSTSFLQGLSRIVAQGSYRRVARSTTEKSISWTTIAGLLRRGYAKRSRDGTVEPTTRGRRALQESRCGKRNLDRWPKRYACAPEHRLVVEAKLNGLSFLDFLKRCRIGPVNNFRFLDPAAIHVHHRNGDTTDNRPENLQPLPAQVHAAHHGQTTWANFPTATIGYDPIVSIGGAREEETYDVTMDQSSQSYVANGFVVHNSGKTREAIYELLRSGTGGTIVAPTHKLLDEIDASCREYADALGLPAPRTRHLRGLLHATEWADVLRLWHERKWQVGRWLSVEGRGEPEPPPDPGTIVLAPHAMLPALRERAVTEPAWLPDPIFVDELPALVATETLHPGDVELLTGRYLTGKLQDWCVQRRMLASAVVAACSAARDYGKSQWGNRVGDETLSRLLVEAAGGEDRLRRMVERLRVAHARSPAPPWPPLSRVMSASLAADHWPRFDTDAALLALLSNFDPSLRELLPPGARGVICAFTSSDGSRGALIEYRYLNPALPRGRSVVVLDATAGIMRAPIRRVAEMSGFTRRLFRLRIRGAEEHFRVAHVRTGEFASRRVCSGTDPVGRAARTVQQVLAFGKELLGSIGFPPNQRPKVGLITHGKVERCIRKIRAWAPVRGALSGASRGGAFRTGHFFGPVRGSNAFLDVDLLVVLGDPKRNTGAMAEEARVLGVVPEELAWASCAAEAEQAIHRLRLIRATEEKPRVVVYVGKEQPPHWTAGNFVQLQQYNGAIQLDKADPKSRRVYLNQPDRRTKGRMPICRLQNARAELLVILELTTLLISVVRGREVLISHRGLQNRLPRLATIPSDRRRALLSELRRITRLGVPSSGSYARAARAIVAERNLVPFDVKLHPNRGRPLRGYAIRTLTADEIAAIRDALFRMGVAGPTTSRR